MEINTLEEDTLKQLKEWVSKGFYIKYKGRENLILNFKLNKQFFKIKINTMKIELLYDKIEEKYEWIKNINNLIKKNMSLIDILTLIEEVYEEDIEELMRQENDMLINKLINDHDINDTKLKELEKKLIQQLDTYIPTQQLKVSDKKYKLFDRNTIGRILVNEHINLKKKLIKDNKVEIDTINNDITKWIIKYRNFENKKLDESLKELDNKYNYNYIELELTFNIELYPNYPPSIKVIRPRLDKKLMLSFSNLIMLKIDYWSVSRTVEFIIFKLYDLLNSKCIIDTNNILNDIKKYPTGSYSKLELAIAKLCTLTDINILEFDNIDDTKYELTANFKQIAIATPTTEGNNSHWAKGTGYGHNNDSKSNWKFEDYLEAQNKKNSEIYEQLLIIFDSINKENIDYDIIKNNNLIEFIEKYLTGVTILEINNNIQIYKIIFNILIELTNEQYFNIFKESTIKILKNISEEAHQIIKLKDKLVNKTDIDNELEIAYIIINLTEIVYPKYENFLKTTEIKEIETEDISTKYINIMDKLKYNICEFNNNYGYEKKPLTNNNSIIRLTKELASLSKNIPIYYESSIFISINEDNINNIRVLISAPKDTPYDSGLFIFDILITNEFPEKPPLMNLSNNGNIRFNPNLYKCGKVCLSLLGTWHGGSKEEQWNSQTSTLQQLLISVQSQIFIDKPYLNEPGYESRYSKEQSIIYNNTYNLYVRYYTMIHAMINIIKNIEHYNEFKDIIINHFKLKKDYILSTCKKWVDESFSGKESIQHSEVINTEKYEKVYMQLKTILDELN